MSDGKPAAELKVSVELVSGLLRAQHPDLAELPLHEFASGWDNQLFTLGGEMIVRVPRRELGAQLVRNEQRWLPELAPHLPLPVPLPLRIGTPTADYPWHWSVVPVFTGETADLAPPVPAQAGIWAGFLLALHQPAPDDAPVNTVRGVPLRDRLTATQQRIERLRSGPEALTPEIERIWDRGLAAADSQESRWLHGDLHAQNVLTHDGALAAVIDWGDITSGDVATDLASTWALFADHHARMEILEHYQPDQPTLDRARGWAVMFGVVLLDSGLSNSPRHATMGRDMLQRLSEDV